MSTFMKLGPARDGDDQPIELLPPCGGRWIRYADGSLEPSDIETAIAAGLYVPDVDRMTTDPTPVA